MLVQFGRRSVDLSQPKIMGILNITPDSFSDGGELFDGAAPRIDTCLQRAEAMLAAGATFLDVGGESTRPGAKAVSSQEELDRVLPVVEALNRHVDAVVSLDTSNAELIKHGAQLGAGLINDVRALTRKGALEAAAETQLPVCLMHMKGEPGTMQQDVQYASVLEEVYAYLASRKQACLDAGIAASKILLDPGIGFGKRDEHNLQLLKRLREFESLGSPLLVGVSRKSMIGRLLKRETDGRLAGSLGFAYASMLNGAKILRVHDVQESYDMLRVFELMGSSAVGAG